jgi:nitrite reductase/ring-hydroxylating ferredoxin subunit
MSFVKVARTADLPPDSLEEVTVGDNCYALCNTGGEVYAVSGLCIHRGGPLGQGALHGTQIVCPWHAWEFDCRTGVYDYNPALKLPTYAVKIDGEDILIDVPEPRP